MVYSIAPLRLYFALKVLRYLNLKSLNYSTPSDQEKVLAEETEFFLF